MWGIVGPLFALATEGLKYVNTKEANKYRDELVSLRTQIFDEEAKGYHSDDQKILMLYGKLAIVAQAAVAEIAPHAA